MARSIIWSFIILLSIISQVSHAQQFLDLEYSNRINPYRYNIGDSFTYQTKDDGIWYTASILDLHRSSGSIYLDNTLIKIEDITKVRTFRNRGWSKTVGVTILTFGASWLFYSAVGSLVDGNENPSNVDWKQSLLIGGTSAVVGFGIQIPFRHETHRLGKKRRLRIVDIRL